MSNDPEREEMELDVTPDPDQLDRNWIDQPRLRLHYGRELADARRDLAQAKADLEVTEAELDLAIRADPKEYGLEKVTETAVKATVLMQPVFKGSQKKLLRCQHSVDVMQAAVSAIDHKKSALEELVRLRLADYYSECRAPEGAKEPMEEMTKAAVRRRGNRGE
jgi:hypothetical protein